MHMADSFERLHRQADIETGQRSRDFSDIRHHHHEPQR
jgi:hypothetical protein